MKIHEMARATGKTTMLLGWLAANPSGKAIMCHSSQAARDLYQSAARMYPRAGLTQQHFIGPSLEALHGSKRTLAIDELDLVLRAIFGPTEIEAATYTPRP